ncbi:MAG: hypothetical protein KIS80_04360 [Anaerolineales bacterium]|nr:hypothetical protein [Anaerolineales bacterium]
MSKQLLTRFFIFLAILIGGCAGQPTVILQASTEVATSAELIETATPSPSAPAVPQAILDQLPKLQAAGLRIEENDEGWALVGRTGDASVRATEAPNMISIIDETGAVIEYSADRYELREMDVVGLDSIQIVKDAQGNVERFYLEEEDVWVTPIEQFSDFARLKEDINLCPRIENEDVWRGVWLRSVALADTEPMPENITLPDYFMYRVNKAPTSYWVMLQDVVNGLQDVSGHINLGINRENDYRKYLSCALTQAENGADVLVGAERVFTPEGKRLYLSYGWGYSHNGEWSLTDTRYGSQLYNLLDSVLLAKDNSARQGHASVILRPLIFFGAYAGAFDGTTQGWLGGVTGASSPGYELYSLPQNNPLALRANFEQTIKEQQRQLPYGGEIIRAGPEIAKLQRMILMSTWIGDIAPEYFASSK